MAEIKISLIEDNVDYRDALATSLEDCPGFELHSQFSTAEVALQYFQDHAEELPHIILLDLRLPSMSGLEALNVLTQKFAQIKIIILSQSDDEENVIKAISAGASGYLLKSSSLADLSNGLKMVMDGGATLDPEVAKYIVASMQKGAHLKQKSPLTQRELEILEHLGAGLSKKEISEKLNIGYDTVDSHVRSIYTKLQVNNAPSAVGKAYKIGILGG